MLVRPFNLSRWFAAVGLVSIAGLSLASAVLLSRLLTEQMPRQEGVLTMELIHGVVLAQHATLDERVGYFVEIYFPVRDADGQIVGAMELYETPRALFAAIQAGERAVWLGAAR